MLGISPPAFLAFNTEGIYIDGGIARGPEELQFSEPVQFVAGRVGAFLADDAPATLTLSMQRGNWSTVAHFPLVPELQTIVVSGENITRARLETESTQLVFDDVRFGRSAGGELTFSPSPIEVTLAAGSQAEVLPSRGQPLLRCHFLLRARADDGV